MVGQYEFVEIEVNAIPNRSLYNLMKVYGLTTEAFLTPQEGVLPIPEVAREGIAFSQDYVLANSGGEQREVVVLSYARSDGFRAEFMATRGIWKFAWDGLVHRKTRTTHPLYEVQWILRQAGLTAGIGCLKHRPISALSGEDRKYFIDCFQHPESGKIRLFTAL